MSVKQSLWITLVACSMVLAGCGQAPSPSPQPASTSEPSPTEASSEPAEEVKVHDLLEEDITRIPNLTSRNLTVMGVKLGDRTVDVNENRALGKPLSTERLGKIYRSAYQERGIYLDFERYTGTVTAIYVNTSLSSEVKGTFASVLTRGDLKIFRDTFGDSPVRSRPDRNTIRWLYPKKGVELIQTRSGDQETYTLKLVKPARR